MRRALPVSAARQLGGAEPRMPTVHLLMVAKPVMVPARSAPRPMVQPTAAPRGATAHAQVANAARLMDGVVLQTATAPRTTAVNLLSELATPTALPLLPTLPTAALRATTTHAGVVNVVPLQGTVGLQLPTARPPTAANLHLAAAMPRLLLPVQAALSLTVALPEAMPHVLPACAVPPLAGAELVRHIAPTRTANGSTVYAIRVPLRLAHPRSPTPVHSWEV